MKKEQSKEREIENKLLVLKGYFRALAVKMETVEPDFVASIIHDNFPEWYVNSDDILWLTNNLV